MVKDNVLKAWGEKPVRCVMMVGGKGSRFASRWGHKSMAPVNDQPIIQHVIEYWRQFTDDFVFVVKHGKEPVIEFVKSLPIKSTFVEPDDLRGIADGLLTVESHIDGPFIVVLGDCFCAGEFLSQENFDYGIGVLPGADKSLIQRNYSVLADDSGKVIQVVEKPENPQTDTCGTGFYFFQKNIFDFIRKTKPSEKTGELEITDVLQTLVDQGERLQALELDGHYVNVNTPDELQNIEAVMVQGNTSR